MSLYTNATEQRSVTGESTTPELPTLEAGLYHLETEGTETGPLQSLALDHVLGTGGEACWIDARGRANTTALARLAPSPRLLDRIRVARGFTAYQHHELLGRLADAATPETTLVVCPMVDSFYREADHGDGERLFASAVATLREHATAEDHTVLVTCQRDDDFLDPLTAADPETLRCTRTEFGPRFRGADFETLVYPQGEYVQTTLAFWARVLSERRDALAAGPAEVTTVGAN